MRRFILIGFAMILLGTILPISFAPLKTMLIVVGIISIGAWLQDECND